MAGLGLGLVNNKITPYLFSRKKLLFTGLFHVGCCCQRNVTLGWEMMCGPESSHNLARLLMCRDINMGEGGLEGVVFDFGCNLHNFLLNREPWEFQFKHVLVDSFHYRNHQACSSSYNTAAYKKFLPAGFYTTGCEQINSKISKIESSLHQMNYKSYFTMLKFFFAVQNLKSNGVLT